MQATPIIACHECDLVQREPTVPADGVARCACCGGELFRNQPDALDRSLAYTLGALILFVIANLFPICGLLAQGNLIKTTLFGSVLALWDNDMRLVAIVVFFTTILFPGAEIAAMLYLMLPLRFERVPRWFAQVFRLRQAVRPWGMIEVYMLGIIVALAKLAHIADVVTGYALWSFGGLIFLLAAAAARFDARVLWIRARLYHA